VNGLTFSPGDLFVRAFAGKDATDAFISYHRKKFPHNNVKGALVGSRTATNLATFDQDYLELCSKIEQVLPRDKSFAPSSYFLKVFGILATAIALEVCSFNHLDFSSVGYIVC
jgi:fatty acid desaturase (delta-4 desaturase)